MTKQEEKAKNSFYTNPLYRFLLEKDVDAFLSRQPKDHFLSVFEENQLGRNRVVLNDYYNTLRSYKLLPSWDAFQDEFNGSLSYANKIYNQQFKGTLSLVRRLFSITVNPLDVESNNLLDINNSSNKTTTPPAIAADSHGGFATIAQRAHDRILKLDQPLYKTNVGNTSYLLNLEDNKKNQSKVKESVDQNLQSKIKGSKLEDLPNLLMHEETQNIVPATSTQSLANGSKIGNLNQKSKASKVLDFPETNNSNVLLSENSFFSDKKKSLSFPLIESTNPTPFYIGWDEKSRKMVITNRLLFSLNQNVPILT